MTNRDFLKILYDIRAASQAAIEAYSLKQEAVVIDLYNKIHKLTADKMIKVERDDIISNLVDVAQLVLDTATDTTPPALLEAAAKVIKKLHDEC